LLGVTVIVCAPLGTVIFARVVMVMATVTGVVPSKVTLIGLKVQVAPEGNPAQLLGLTLTTAAVDPGIAAIISVIGGEVECPAAIETADGDAVN
jgi:hypothetical protein